MRLFYQLFVVVVFNICRCISIFFVLVAIIIKISFGRRDIHNNPVDKKGGEPKKLSDKKTVYEFTGVQHARRALRPFRKAICSAQQRS